VLLVVFLLRKQHRQKYFCHFTICLKNVYLFFLVANFQKTITLSIQVRFFLSQLVRFFFKENQRFFNGSRNF